MKKLLFLLALIPSIALSTDIICYNNSKGLVCFPHGTHKDFSWSNNCKPCHYVHNGSIIPTVGHTLCQSCHVPKVVGCSFCHNNNVTGAVILRQETVKK